MLDGKRTQRFFRTKSDAHAWMSSLHQDLTDQFWQGLTVQERQLIMITHQNGISSPAPSLHPRRVNDAVHAFLEIKQHQQLRPKTFKQIRCILLLLSKALGELYCHQIEPGMIEEWFRSRQWNRNTIDGVIAKVGPFFSWCIREAFCSKNPLKSIILPKQEDAPVCIFTVPEVERLMHTALEKDPGLVPYLALGIFAGIRPDEIMRLEWKDIRPEGIVIEGHKAKTRQRRIVKVSDNLQQWAIPSGELPIKNKRKRLEAIRERADMRWGHDIMRHTFASYHLARWCSPDQTAHELGHRDTRMLYRHYRELVTSEEAKKFWAIKPGA